MIKTRKTGGKEKLKRMVNSQNAITLVALVITIIIIIILATVTINMAFGDNGLIKQAELAKDMTANSIVAENEDMNRIMQEYNDIMVGNKGIPITNAEQLLKIGTGEEVEINGNVYKFDLGKTYVLQNDIEYIGSYDNVANLIKNNEIEFQGQAHKIVVTNESGIKEYYTEESKYYIATNSYGYVSRGLELYYDGIDNVGEGIHSNTTTVWKDLSGNNRDGTLNNFGTSAVSGWNSEYLSLDGVNDWVNCGELNSENVTLEAVHRLKSDADGDRCILGNLDGGGNGIFASGGTLMGNLYTNLDYHGVDSGVDASVYRNQILTQTLTYDGQEEIIYVDGEKKASELVSGIIEYPVNNTVMALGVNPSGNASQLSYADTDVYTIRIYSRGLSQEEIEINNRVDNRRFKEKETIPIYTGEQLLKVGTGEQVFVEQENKTYTFGNGLRYELKNDVALNGDYTSIANKINNKEVELVLNDYKITNNGVYYTASSKYTIAVNQYGYVVNGLQLLYDGIDNTGTGHSSTTTVWKDLSGNNRDGTLKNMDVSSSWKNDGLKFDGLDDFVLIAEMNYDNITIETVCTKSSDVRYSEIISNVNSGGYEINEDETNRFIISVYVEENSEYIKPSRGTQSQDIDINSKYSISGSYDGQIMKIRTSNGSNRATTYQETAVAGTIGKPTHNTYMVLGANPTGQQVSGSFYNGEISSVRIYNRALSDEENAVNYLNDRERYNL